MKLKTDTLLKGGEYKILKVLGQGGFGITYLAEWDVVAEGSIGKINTTIKVALKEFFIKDLCDRNSENSHVSAGSTGSRELVDRFKAKFIKEARNISKLEHEHIIKVLDVFEENGTAYYAMEYISGGSLDDKVAEEEKLTEVEAVHYTCQIAYALHYIHTQNINHLDVKPSNILIKDGAVAVLIDFGLAKRYDSEGEQTTSTPVGVSKGYAPMEQYNQGGVSSFSPATDIYSLGATLYRFATGERPPHATEVFDGGLPALPAELSSEVKTAIQSAMQPARKDRPQSIEAFLTILIGSAEEVESEKKRDEVQEESEETNILYNQEPKIDVWLAPEPVSTLTSETSKRGSSTNKGVVIFIFICFILILIMAPAYGAVGIVGAIISFLLIITLMISSDKVLPSFTNEDYEALGSPSELVMPRKYETIARKAFYNNGNLVSIVIPNTVTMIEDSAFAGCANLTSITIPASVTSIEDSAFAGCINLTSIFIPDSVAMIGDNVFEQCHELTAITVSKNNPIYSKLKTEYGVKVK